MGMKQAANFNESHSKSHLSPVVYSHRLAGFNVDRPEEGTETLIRPS